jgi:excisionase family DNA binding protein
MHPAPPAPRHGRLLSVDQSAAWLNVSRTTIYGLIRDGRIRTYRVGLGRGKVLIAEGELERFLATCREEPDFAGAASANPAPRSAPRRLRRRPAAAIEDHFA